MGFVQENKDKIEQYEDFIINETDDITEQFPDFEQEFEDLISLYYEEYYSRDYEQFIFNDSSPDNIKEFIQIGERLIVIIEGLDLFEARRVYSELYKIVRTMSSSDTEFNKDYLLNRENKEDMDED